MHPWHHAVSSANKYGGEPADYLPLHQFFDQSKQFFPDLRHRALLHNTWGIFLAERIFGPTLTNSAGRVVPTRFIGEQHVKEDLLRIPTVQDWLECLVPQPWMLRRGKLLSETLVPAEGNSTEIDVERASDTAGGQQSSVAKQNLAAPAFQVEGTDGRETLTIGKLQAELDNLSDASPLGEQTLIYLSAADREIEGLTPPVLAESPTATVALLRPWCDGCGHTPGVRIDAHPDCAPTVPPGYVVIERCDACQRFDDDLQAAQSVADDARWIIRQGRHEYAIGKPRTEKVGRPANATGSMASEIVALLREVHELVYDQTESFQLRNIGSDLAYLLGAIVNNNACEWSAERPLVTLLREHLDDDHPVWHFICLAEDNRKPA